MKRAIIVILDSLGIGAMEDYLQYRETDGQANTFGHILDQAKYIEIPNMERLGINKIINHKRLLYRGDTLASYGTCRLKHQGADSYLGHQEIMGSSPLKPVITPFRTVIDEVLQALEKGEYRVEQINGPNPCLLVEGKVVVADNIESDFGQIYNVTAALDEIPFEDVLKIGAIVRGAVKVNRVIALGGSEVRVTDILNAIETTKAGATGVNCPKSGVYKKGYKVKHMGYGVDTRKQISSLLIDKGLEVNLIGKMADIIDCHGAKYFTAIETDRVMCDVLYSMETMEGGLISATVQETDLSGHAQDIDRYATKINTVDLFLNKIIEKMTDEDLLIISADHGNDPTIGHNNHTREKVFVLAYSKRLQPAALGERHTLADIAATISEFFNIEKTEGGESFWNEMIKTVR